MFVLINALDLKVRAYKINANRRCERNSRTSGGSTDNLLSAPYKLFLLMQPTLGGP